MFFADDARIPLYSPWDRVIRPRLPEERASSSRAFMRRCGFSRRISRVRLCDCGCSERESSLATGRGGGEGRGGVMVLRAEN